MSSPAIVFLVLAILAATAVLLYYLRRRLRSLPLLRHSTAAAPPPHISLSSRRQVSPAPSSASAGLLLPRFKFTDVKRPGSVTFAGDCAICLAEFLPEHHLRLLPLCLHAFHVDCIDTWLAGDSQICPVCRAEIFRTDSDLLRTTAAGSFRIAIGNVSRGRRPEAAANSSSRVNSIRGGELNYVVEEDWELELRDAVLPEGGGEEDDIVAVDIDSEAPLPTAAIAECQSSCGMVFTGSSRRWTELSEGIELLSRWLS